MKWFEVEEDTFGALHHEDLGDQYVRDEGCKKQQHIEHLPSEAIKYLDKQPEAQRPHEEDKRMDRDDPQMDVDHD